MSGYLILFDVGGRGGRTLTRLLLQTSTQQNIEENIFPENIYEYIYITN
jgi:hypothetical protein